MQSYTDSNSSSPPWIQMLQLLCWHFCSWGELSVTLEHTWHWFVYGSAHFLSDATLSSSGPASGSTYRVSASGRVYSDGSWNKTTRLEPHRDTAEAETGSVVTGLIWLTGEDWARIWRRDASTLFLLLTKMKCEMKEERESVSVSTTDTSSWSSTASRSIITTG